MADIAGYYRAFGLRPGELQRRRVDHLSMELEFMAWLIFKEEAAYGQRHSAPGEAATCVSAQRSFFRDHLSWWLPAFARGLHARAGAAANNSDTPARSESYHQALARALASFTACERSILRIPLPQVKVSPLQVDEGECDSCEADCDELLSPNRAEDTPMPRTPYAC